MRSFSQAGAKNDISQPAVSQAINHLEKHLGTKLLDRNKRPIELTRAGEVYYRNCKQILAQFRTVEDEVQKLGQKKVAGRLRLCSIYSAGLLQMNQYVREFEQNYPDVEIDLSYMHPEEIYESISAEHYDLGIISYPKGTSEFEITHWQDQKMVLVTSNEHHLAVKPVADGELLHGEKLVTFTPNLVIRKKIDNWLKKLGITMEVVYEFDNVEYVKRCVEINNGIAILPYPTVVRELELRTLKMVEINNCDLVRPMGLIRKRGRAETMPIKLFIDRLINEHAAVPTQHHTSHDGSFVNNGVCET
jgi:DNA-binding transcriptional LysR family regulator